jgi:RimJ/RimL family protein N-acetyltransferase
MNPILIDFPVPIRTERFQIRPAAAGEGVLLNAAIAESFAELHPWMPWAQTMPSVEDSEAFVRDRAAKFLSREEFHLHVWDHSGDRLLGCVGLHPKRWEPPRVFEIGYWLRTSETRRGVATETAAALATFAFDVLKANRLCIRCDDRNLASARVAEKIGFELEGIARCDSADHDGVFRDTRIYARVRR